MHLALVTCDLHAVESAAAGDWYRANILQEDHLLTSALAELGHTCQRVSWSDRRVSWTGFDAAIFRSTWDYFHRFDQFNQWLMEVATQTRLCNPESIVRWNMDKHYLLELQAGGLPIVPSILLEPGTQRPLVDILTEYAWEQAVIKPCVSGAARHTHRIDYCNAAEVDSQLAALRLAEAFLIQPFQATILDQGEETLVMAGDVVTHAVRKRAKPGDFRVQDDFGGTVEACQADEDQIQLAQRAMRACRTLPAYGRVDMVRSSAGDWLIMELELIEPELWMRFHPQSAHAIAEAIERQLTQ